MREKPLVPRVHCCILMWHIVLACSSLWIGSRIFLELDTYLNLYLKSFVPWFTSKFLCFRVLSERRLTRGVPKWQPISTRFKIMVIVIIKRAWRECRKEFHKKWSPGDLLAYMLFEIKKMFHLIFKIWRYYSFEESIWYRVTPQRSPIAVFDVQSIQVEVHYFGYNSSCYFIFLSAGALLGVSEEILGAALITGTAYRKGIV